MTQTEKKSTARDQLVNLDQSNYFAVLDCFCRQLLKSSPSVWSAIKNRKGSVTETVNDKRFGPDY